MPAPTDFGSPKRPATKKKPEDSNKLSVKVKGKPAEVKSVLGRMSGVGDAPAMKPPGPNGPKGLHPTRGGFGKVSAPLLNKPLGQTKGRKPVVKPVSFGSGDPPVPLTGGVQALTPETTPRVYTRRKKPSAKIPSNNPESPRKRGGPGGPKAYLPNEQSLKPLKKTRSLNPFMTLKTPEAKPAKGGRERPTVSNDMPPRSEPRQAPEPKPFELNIKRERSESSPALMKVRMGKGKP